MKRIGRLIPKSRIYSLTIQLVAYYTIISLIVLSIGFYLSYAYMSNLLKGHNERFVLQQFHQSDSNIQNLMKEVNRLSSMFLLDEDIQDFLQQNYNIDSYADWDTEIRVLKKINIFLTNYNYINSIYIYTKSKISIGSSANRTYFSRDKNDKNQFFFSDTYKNVEADYPKIIWSGGKNESYYNPDLVSDDDFLITAAKGMKPLIEPKINAVLIFNLSEKYLTSVYAGTENSVDDYMAIIDSNKKVLSSCDGKNIGKELPELSSLEAEGDSGSVTKKVGNIVKQIVYYKVKNSDWVLIKEIPLEYFTSDISEIRRIVAIIFISSFLFLFILTAFWMRKIINPIHILTSKMRDVGKGNLGLTIQNVPRNELGLLINGFNEMSNNILGLIQKNNEIQEEKRTLEIETLHTQINPHFIYNTLNIIRWMAAIANNKNIVESIVALGNILRPAFRSSITMCTVREEQEYVENYLKIMNLRFGNSIGFDLDIQNDVLDYKLPRFIIQPLIENAINHGMKINENGIIIHIEVVKIHSDLIIRVIDNGNGITQEKLTEINSVLNNPNMYKSDELSRKVGINNVNRRIRLNFGNAYGLSIESQVGEGTCATIKMPAIE